MNFQWHESRRGNDCPHDDHWYGQVVQGNGVVQVRAVCSSCTAVSTPIAHREFERTIGVEAKFLPIFRDHRDGEPCARCGSTNGVELHHWAPQAKFADAHVWPTSWLCIPCHQKWHAVMDGRA